jgi:hypothetical protein
LDHWAFEVALEGAARQDGAQAMQTYLDALWKAGKPMAMRLPAMFTPSNHPLDFLKTLDTVYCLGAHSRSTAVAEETLVRSGHVPAAHSADHGDAARHFGDEITKTAPAAQSA